MNNILIPCRILKVEDAKGTAKEILTNSDKEWSYLTADLKQARIERKALSLLQSFESLLELKLEEGHFVPDAPFPDPNDFDDTPAGDRAYLNASEAFTLQQEKVLFEGFEKGTTKTLGDGTVTYYHTDSLLLVKHTKNDTIEWGFSEKKKSGIAAWWITIGVNPSIKDLLYHIEKYNETAAQKIELTWTKNLLKYLKIKG